MADAVYTNSIEGKYEHINAERTAEIQYVAKLYKNIPDGEVSVSDREVKSYYNATRRSSVPTNRGPRHQLRQDPVGASESDIKAMEIELEDVADGWKDAEDAEAFAKAANDGKKTSELAPRPSRT